MDPVYGCMPLYPYQRGQVHYRPCCPNAESVPTPVHPDQAPFPINYQCCPWGGSYNYPVYSHGGCNHGHHSWRLPYSHLPPVHCHGNYPPFQSTHPNPYVPFPDYSIGHPRYEYEKNMPKEHHCCGCPNHPCNKKEEKNVRIQEEDIDREKKDNDSLVPLQFKNFPVVWLPPESSYSKENRNSNDLKVTEHKEDSNDSTKSVEQKPSIWNEWYPHNVRNLGSPKKNGGYRVRTQNQEDDDKERFPFPIFWMPYKPGEMEKNEREVNNVGPEPSKESINLADNGDILEVNEEQTKHNAPSRTKDIPVKQVDELVEKGDLGDLKGKENNVSVKDTKEKGDKKSSEGSATRKSPLPPKASKLPLVCLRVDPLPRRKTANGSSRSPSPPGDKGKLNGTSNKASTVTGPKEIVPNVNKDNEPKKETTNNKTIEAMEGKSEQGGNIDLKTSHPNLPITVEKGVQENQTDERSTEEKHSRECSRADKADIEGQSNDKGSQVVEREEIPRVKEVIVKEAKESERKKLRDSEAAIIIQSAYRGFAIRRWDPLKKLKQIANVREQIAAIKLLIQEMALSSDVHSDYKKIHMTGETIMNLLLKLDTVQGLHPSIRDIRKSVARELVGLQEKLDSLINKNSEVSLGLGATTKGALEETKDDGSIQGEPRVENPSVDGSLSTNTTEARGCVAQSCNDQVDGGSQSENVEMSDTALVQEQLSGNVEDKSMEILENCSIEQIHGGPEAELGDEQNCEVQENKEDEQNCEVQENKEDEQNCEVQENKEDLISVPLTETETATGQEMADSQNVDGDTFPSEMAEFPCGVLDDDSDAQACIEHPQTISGELEVAENKVKVDVERERGIEEGSKSDMVTIELEDDDKRDEHKENVAMPVELLPKQDDIQVQVEEEETSPADELVETLTTDVKIGSDEHVENKLEEDAAQSGGNSLLIAEHAGTKMHELEAADDESGQVLIVEDKLGDDVSNSDERSSQPCIVGSDNGDPQGSDVKIDTEDEVDDKLGDTQAHLPVEAAEEKLGDAMAASDECPFRVPQDTWSNIREQPKGAEEKIQSEERVENKLGDAIAESDDYTSDLQQNVREKINETTGVPDEQKLQIVEESFQGEDDPRNSTASETVLDMPIERKSSTAREHNNEQIQLEEPTEVKKSESPIKKIASDSCLSEVTEVENEQISPASPTRSSDMTDSNQKLLEENEKLREMMEKLIKAGQEQLATISSLSGRVKDLEKQLSRRKKLKTRRINVPSPGSSCKKASQDHFKGGYTGVVM